MPLFFFFFSFFLSVASSDDGDNPLIDYGPLTLHITPLTPVPFNRGKCTKTSEMISQRELSTDDYEPRIGWHGASSP